MDGVARVRYVFSYVYGIDRETEDGHITVWSEERDVNYDEKQRSKDIVKVGIYKFEKFVVVLYARQKVQMPRSGWADLAYMLGVWHCGN